MPRALKDGDVWIRVPKSELEVLTAKAAKWDMIKRVVANSVSWNGHYRPGTNESVLCGVISKCGKPLITAIERQHDEGLVRGINPARRVWDLTLLEWTRRNKHQP